MGRFNELLIDPPRSQLLQALSDATQASGRGRWHPGRVRMDDIAWDSFTAHALSRIDGCACFEGELVDNHFGGFVAVAWWTDAIRRRHFAVLGGDHAVRCEDDFDAHRWTVRTPALALVYPDRTYVRIRNEHRDLLVACDCGVVGRPGDISWVGSCCGPCFDRYEELGHSPSSTTISERLLRTGPDAIVLAATPNLSAIIIRQRAQVSVWRPDSRELSHLSNLPPCELPYRYSGAVSPEGAVVALGVGLELVIANLHSGESTSEYTFEEAISAIAWLPGSADFAVALSDGRILLKSFTEDHGGEEVVFRCGVLPETMVAGEGRILAVMGDILRSDQTTAEQPPPEEAVVLRIPQVISRRRYAASDSWHDRPGCAMAVSRDGTWLAIARFSADAAIHSGESFIELLEVGTNRWMHRIEGEPPDRFLALTFTPDGQWLIAADQRGTIRSWHIPDLEQGPTLECHPAMIHQLQFGLDARELLMGMTDGSIRRCPWQLLLST